MEAKQECKSCKTSWEEDKYWKHFNAFSFLVTLPSHFHHHLVLPEKFASLMKDRLPEKVSLIGPSGASWEVELQKSNHLLFAGNGWKDFVNTHNLNENCYLMFKCERNLSLKVLIFDKRSLCERESTYFIQKCSHTELGHEDQGFNERELLRTEIIEYDDEEEDSVIFVSEKLIADDGPEACSGGPRKHELSPSTRVRGQSTSTIRLLPKECMSNTREVTEKEKKDALQRAIQEETETSFTVVLRPSAVYRGFILNIPKAWLHKHPLRAKQNVLLRIGEKTLLTRVNIIGKNIGARLLGGWKTFVLDNSLEEIDVLVFKLVSQKEEANVVMDVDIFRVVSSTI